MLMPFEREYNFRCLTLPREEVRQEEPGSSPAPTDWPPDVSAFLETHALVRSSAAEMPADRFVVSAPDGSPIGALEIDRFTLRTRSPEHVKAEVVAWIRDLIQQEAPALGDQELVR